jgi:hypothetical protein
LTIVRVFFSTFQVGGVLAEANNGIGDREAAFLLWLQSIKRLPQVYSFKVASIADLLRTSSTSPTASRKALALQYVDMHSFYFARNFIIIV